MLHYPVGLAPIGTSEHIIVETDVQELVLLWQDKARQCSDTTIILDNIEDIATTLTSLRLVHTLSSSNFMGCLYAQYAFPMLEIYFSPHPSFLKRCELTVINLFEYYLRKKIIMGNIVVGQTRLTLIKCIVIALAFMILLLCLQN